MTTKKDNRPEPSRSRLPRNRFLKIGVISVALLCGLAGIAVARYMQTTHADVAVRVKEFYFTSDLLNEEEENTHTLSPGSKSISFTLGNHADELRYSEVDINYEVKVERENGDSTNLPTISKNPTNTLEKDKKDDQKITISDLSPGTYIITATAKGGDKPANGHYTQTLSAKIVVPPEGALLYQYQEPYPDYFLLTVWNEGDAEKGVTITYTGIPDNTNPNMKDWTSGSDAVPTTSASITIGAHESKVFRFFGGRATASNAAFKSLN